MKKPYRKDLASHSGPESCRVTRERDVEALTGGSAGCAIELRNRPAGDDRVDTTGQSTPGDAQGRVSTGPDAVLDHRACSKLHAREPGELAYSQAEPGRSGKPMRHKPESECKQSDRCVVPTNSLNKARRCVAEGREGRRLPKGNVRETTEDRTQSRASSPDSLERVRERARRDKDVKFTALLNAFT